MTTPPDPGSPPSVAEIAALTARLRQLSDAGRDVDPAERAAFLADKDALIDRIEAAVRATVPAPTEIHLVDYVDLLDCLSPDEAQTVARAAAGGYAMVGPSARTWAVDPVTGVPTGPVPDAEHRRVRDLIAREWLDGAEPVWLPCTDGSREIVSRVVRFPEDVDDPLTEGDGRQADGPPADRAAEPDVVDEPVGWHTVQAARDAGATWAQIAAAAGTDPLQARAGYFAAVDDHELAGAPAGEVVAAWAAGGRWTEELRPDTPAEVVAQIAETIAARDGRDDDPALDALRARWWNPHHSADPPTVATEPGPTDHETSRDNPAVNSADRRVGHDDADGWFCEGADAAHQAYLDALGHVHADEDTDTDATAADGDTATRGQPLPLLPIPMPAVMLDGIEERRTEPAERDDPVELAARLAELRRQAAPPAASVGAPAAASDDRIYSATEAAAALTGRGVDAETAAAMVERYLSDLTERAGWEPANGWAIDGDDLAAMLDPPPPVGAGMVELALAEGSVPTFGPDDAELDDLHAQLEDAREEGRSWLPSGAETQWRERDEPGPDGRRWELRDVTGEPSAVADDYGSTHGTGYDWWGRETDPTAEHGLTGAEGVGVPAGPVLSAEAAAHVLAVRAGRPLDEARADVSRYLDDVSELLGAPAHDWGLDDADLAALSADADTRPPTASDTAAAGGPTPEVLAEDERRDQLTRWHADDVAAAAAAVTDLDDTACLDRGEQ